MSDRVYVPGVSAPKQLNTHEASRVLIACGEGIRSGMPAPNNSLGLYIETTQNGTPVFSSYAEPYVEPSNELIETLSRQSTEASPPDRYLAAGGLILGGVKKYAESLDLSSAERHYIYNQSKVLRFGGAVCALVCRESARLAINEGHANTVESLRQIVDASYEGTVGLLARLERNAAAQAEVGLGFIPPVYTSGQAPFDASFVFDEYSNSVAIKLPDYIRNTAHQPRCGAQYMTLEDGTSLHRAIWDRTLEICATLPWLFAKDVDNLR